MAEKSKKRGKLKGVKVTIDRKEGIRCASAKNVREFREGEAVAKETIFDLRVVEGVEDVEDGCQFVDAV